MDHWTIGDAELRRQVGMQTERYRELRRRSDEVRLIEAGRSPHPTLGERLHAWLQATWCRARRPHASEQVSGADLEHGRG